MEIPPGARDGWASSHPRALMSSCTLPCIRPHHTPLRRHVTRLPTQPPLPRSVAMVLADGIVVRENTGVGGSRGLYASVAIRAGEMVWREEPEAEPQFTSTPRTLAWVEALPAEAQAAYRHFMYKTGEDEYQSLPEFNDLPFDQYVHAKSADPSMYMNHSCEPTCWFEGNYLMTATRDIAPGDEITFDYCTSNDWPQDWACACGSASCRGRISGGEWRDAGIQAKYAGHFLPHIQARIARMQAQQ